MRRFFTLFLIIVFVFACNNDDDYSITTPADPLQNNGDNLGGEQNQDYTESILALNIASFGNQIGWAGGTVGSRQEIEKYLKNTHFATKGDWSLKWWANYNNDETVVNGGIIIQDTTVNNKFALSIEGAQLANHLSDSLNQDIYVYEKYRNQYNVSRGINQLRLNVLKMKDTESAYPDATIVDYFVNYINEDPENHLPITIYSASISQGSALSIILATDLYEAISSNVSNLKAGDVNIRIFCYATPSHFSQEYADYFNNLPRSSDSSAPISIYFRDHVMNGDQIPQKFAWDFQHADSIPYPISFGLKTELKVAGEALYAKELAAGVSYVEVQKIFNGDHIFIPKNLGVHPPNLPDTLKTQSDFEAYVDWNHWHNNYMLYLGGPCVDPSNPNSDGKTCENPGIFNGTSNTTHFAIEYVDLFFTDYIE
ncbi:hypothetical protein [Aureivirga marina]|uniref:hypothetical protein n=1 Tax=Aureivirga marina TaxID=1182451 RepID=UPI0018C91C0A|nr:hypothetical protein [Aureivirga marina]